MQYENKEKNISGGQYYFSNYNAANRLGYIQQNHLSGF